MSFREISDNENIEIYRTRKYRVVQEIIDKGTYKIFTYKLYDKKENELCYLRENQMIPNFINQIINYYEKNKKIIF